MMDMNTTGSRIVGLLATALAIGVLGAGCASSGGHPAAGPTTAPASASAPTTAAGPPPISKKPAVPPASAGTRTELAALKQQLDAAGASLGAAGNAIAQSDPNQTKGEEGSAP